jgi:O-acetyl-ADP-ribose deacetylase (regulator of RNase III)
MERRYVYKGVEILVLKGDITDVEADAIVNAANKYLRHGGGVAAAIVRKGGEEIQRESNKIVSESGPLEVGEAVATTAGKLKAKKVIHTVGPIYGEGKEREKLMKAVLNSLRLAERLGLKSIAFPAISTGIYRIPPKMAADAMTDSILNYIDRAGDSGVQRIMLVLYTSSMHEDFLEILEKKLREKGAHSHQ